MVRVMEAAHRMAVVRVIVPLEERAARVMAVVSFPPADDRTEAEQHGDRAAQEVIAHAFMQAERFFDGVPHAAARRSADRRLSQYALIFLRRSTSITLGSRVGGWRDGVSGRPHFAHTSPDMSLALPSGMTHRQTITPAS